MTTETILTDTKRAAFEAACAQHAEDAGYESHERLARDGDGYADPHTQAAWWGWCEALQSPEVRAWKRDAEAFRLMVSKRLTVSVRELGHEIEVFHMDDCLAWPACDPNADDDTRAEVARYAIATAVAAMEQQK